MSGYKTRKIEFKELYETDGWSIKIYTITKTDNFALPEFYQNVKEQLPSWLAMENSFESSNDKIGFLILHAGSEGIFSIINWWVGANMLNTHIFLTDPREPDDFTKISGDGLAPCIWELEVINHERLSWLSNVMKNESDPNYQAYLADVFNVVI